MSFHLTCTAFQDGQAIPQQYTQDGTGISPPLAWNDPPRGTQALALVCEDPDAPRGTFTHWVLFNLPPDTRELPAGLPTKPILASGAVQGTNDMGAIGYAGPAPPRGKPHRYFFKLYALDTALTLPAGASAADFTVATRNHVLAESMWMGTYRR